VPRPILLHHHAFGISRRFYATTGLAPNNQRTILKSGGDFSIGAVSQAARKEKLAFALVRSVEKPRVRRYRNRTPACHTAKGLPCRSREWCPPCW
jgi:hypothetical protein